MTLSASVLQRAGSWPPVPRENQVPQETYLHAPPLGPGVLSNTKKQNTLCTMWYAYLIPASWRELTFTKHSIHTRVLYYRFIAWCLKFLPICGGGCPFLGAGGGGWGGTRYAANNWDLDDIDIWESFHKFETETKWYTRLVVCTRIRNNLVDMVEKVAANLCIPIGRMLQQDKAKVWRKVPQQVQVALDHSQPLPRLQGRERHNSDCFQLYSPSPPLLSHPYGRQTHNRLPSRSLYMEEHITLYSW